MILIVGLGPGDSDSVPAVAIEAIAGAHVVFSPPLGADLQARIGVAPTLLGEDLSSLPEGAVVAAPDSDAWRLAGALPGARTLPTRDALRSRAIGADVARLVAVGRRLRAECPWDRVQTAETIVPHTIEEAFEVAEAINSGDPAHQADELGDLLFQSVFLAQLLEESHPIDLGTIASEQADKLISRHPHVYGEMEAHDASGVVDIWEQRKREERPQEGIFHELPVGLPALAFAAKVCKRAATVGFEFPGIDAALGKLHEEVGELTREPVFEELGDVLFAAIGVARQIGADPELALRSSAQRFRTRVERAAALAAASGDDFERLGLDDQLTWYRTAVEALSTDPPWRGASPTSG